jgi:hypothetical protein
MSEVKQSTEMSSIKKNSSSPGVFATSDFFDIDYSDEIVFFSNKQILLFGVFMYILGGITVLVTKVSFF